MELFLLTKKARGYAFLSLILPLVALTLCLILYNLLGEIQFYKKINWQDNITIRQLTNNQIKYNFIDCPKYKLEKKYFKYSNGKVKEVKIVDKNLYKDPDTISKFKKLNANLDNKIIEIIYRHSKSEKEFGCVKNKPIFFMLLSNFSFVEKILIETKLTKKTGFSKIKNPYFYGEISISRSARYYPANLIFKPLIIMTAIFLFLYWKNNLNIFRKFSVNNNTFFYLGSFSCLFLILHASFLGLDFDSKLFAQIRKVIIIMFILLEIAAQVTLTISLVKYKKALEKYIKFTILKIKVVFIVFVFLLTVSLILILALSDPSTAFKNIAEWNYFTFLLIYYLLSGLLWKKVTS